METLNITVGNGINNKARSESMPEGYVRSATNVDFDNSGNAYDRDGYTLDYSGTDIHSLWHWDVNQSERYFIEGSDLKHRDSNGTISTIKTGVGNGEVSFTHIANRVLFSNDTHAGSIIHGNYQDWGVTRPSRQPDASESTGAGMFGGEYQVAATWLRNGEESGTVLANEITITDGAGIRLSNFPVPPSDITHVAVYVSSVNSKDLYLFGEYPANVDEVYIDKHISDIPLTTQFGNKPLNFEIIEGHYGRIYGSISRHLYYSNAQNFGLFNPRNHWAMPDVITGIISVPGALYVGTKENVYRLSNIDLDGVPTRTVVKDYGMVKMLNTAYDTNNEVGYFLGAKGYCVATSEGITEITEQNVAMDKYGQVSITIRDKDGFKRLIGVSQEIVKISGLKASV